MASGGEVGGQKPDSVENSGDLSELTCQPCHEDGKIRESVGICVDCQDYLCLMCYDSHTIPKPMRKHILLDKQQMLKSQVKFQNVRKDKCTTKCSEHDEKSIKYFCIGHGKLGCSVCLSLNHRTCKSVQFIPDVAQNLANSAEFKQTDSSFKSASKLSFKFSKIEKEHIELIQSSCIEALDHLETHRGNVNDAFDKIQADIVEKAEMMKLRALKKITNITDKYRETQRELQELQTRTEPLQRRQQNCDLYIEMMQMKDRLKVLEGEMKEAQRQLSLHAAQIKFTPNLELLDMLKNTNMCGKLTGAEYGTIVKAEHLLDMDVKATSDSVNCPIAGSTFVTDSKLVIADNNNCNIKIVDMQQQRVIAQTEVSSSPVDVCTIKPNQVAATLPREEKIVLLKVGGIISLDRTIRVNGECRGVDYKDDKLAVSFTSKPYKVQVINLQGTVLHDIMTDQQGQPLFNTPCHLTFDKAGASLYVTNYNGNSVVRMKLDGTLMATYKDTELQRPAGSVTDSDGNVYVCGWASDNIHQISPDCRKLRVLLGRDDGIMGPWSISYRATDDTFWMGRYENTINVYQAIRDSQ